MKVVVVPVSDQKARQHKEQWYPYMELAQKTEYNVRKNTIKNIAVMRYEYQVRRHGAYTC